MKVGCQRSINRVGEVFRAFLLLGLTSFGGPVAHLGYFRAEFVLRRQWLSDQEYADVVALCQFLPGPASSQVGFALGLMRAGALGAFAAWTAFTLPSALILVLFAFAAEALASPSTAAIIHGLKIVAVAIVAHAVWGMSRTLCPDVRRAGIALAAAGIVLVMGAMGQIAAIFMGVVMGLAVCRVPGDTGAGEFAWTVSRRAGRVALVAFVILFVGLPVLAGSTPSVMVEMIDGFFRAGSLVFGGGHVILPLLEAEVVRSGWVTADEFLAGYGAAQAVPGPLFTFAGYLGAIIAPAYGGVPGAFAALLAIFIPGMLLLLAVLPYWADFRRLGSVQGAMRGANAAVVGILAAALYQPVWVSAIVGFQDFLLALLGFILLAVWQVPAWVVVAVVITGGLIIAT